ncbi:LOW QUALITY PROTEIN: Reverse transcriptase [Phytophthora palmivora]|uniref:Reverse transcriptase n=1 Tax=Phytophthora palmivora TaxID=4796 RepID=A0A2P4YMX6_9STRA|nr:LOW QUALITY PROTEIN: Reverse transcriptase [Phytophthora palmivora]
MGIRKPSELCVLAYVGPELRNQNQDNLQYMTSLIDHEPGPLECTRTWYSRPPLPAEPEGPAQFKLNFGERYGWWAHHDEKEDKQQVATVHGALKLNSQKRIKVSGLGGVPTYITASTQIKITLGRRVVYILDVWVTNIGEVVDVLLGMDFMYSAGVRLCIHEGTVALPDEESVLMYGYMIRKHRERNIPITPLEDVHLRPEEHVNVKIRYGECQPLRDVVWASRGDQWAKSWAVAVKVVNISDKDLWIDSSTPVARIVEYGCFPRAGRFVRPGVRRYQEWQHLIYESTLSTQARMRKERYEQALRDTAPPAVPKRSYQWPAKLLMRPQAKDDEVRVVRQHKRPMTVISECADGSEPECVSQKGEKPVFPIMDHPSTPLERLEEDYIQCMRVNAEELEQEPAVYIHEGSDMMSQLKDQLAMLPELQDLSPRCDISKADVGEPGITTDVQECQLKEILKRHRSIFLGDGNAAPAPARVAIKVYELLKKLMETKLIEHSESPWASPIVIVLKKNGVDIRMCIDYRVVNSFIRLSNYPLPLIDDLLTGFEGDMWFMSLDMASGFWAVRMAERAKLISAFWVRMPFGLKNAPLVYQHMINNCLWGFVRLPPEEEVLVDQDVLDYLKLEPQRPERSEVDRHQTALTEQMTVFRRNIPAPSQMGPVLGRSSYIDDIAHGAKTWDELCEDLDGLLHRLRYRSISVSLPKSEFGKRTIPYLSHEIGAEGIRAIPKIVTGIQYFPFPSTLKGVQSFLGSLNYYHKFIEDFPVVAAVLYELSDEQRLVPSQGGVRYPEQKIVSTPLLRHPDRTKPFVIIPHANHLCCAVLGQEHDGIIQPVRFTGRVLNDAELRYHIAEKEVLAVIRVLHVFKTLIEGCPLVVYTRHSVLKWVIKSKTADGHLFPWGVALSQYDLEIRKVQRDEDRLAAILGAGITPREHLGKIAESLIPAKGRVKAPPVISIEMLEADYSGVVLSFDGAAKTSRIGSCGCVLWQLPEWKVLDARGYILDGVTVNDAEYSGLLRSLAMACDRGIQDLVVVGDSRIVIQQVQGLINCNQPNLQRRLAECEVLKKRFNSVCLADYRTSKTLTLGKSWVVEGDAEREHLKVVSRIQEQLMKTSDEETKSNSEMPRNSPNVVTMRVSGDGALHGPDRSSTGSVYPIENSHEGGRVRFTHGSP